MANEFNFCLEVVMKLMFWIIALSLLSTPVVAGTTARIDHILLYDGGNLVYVYPEGGVQNPPACHGSNGDYLTFSMDRPMAREYLSALMMAFAMQKTISFATAGACIDQSVSETITYFSVFK